MRGRLSCDGTAPTSSSTRLPTNSRQRSKQAIVRAEQQLQVDEQKLSGELVTARGVPESHVSTIRTHAPYGGKLRGNVTLLLNCGYLDLADWRRLAYFVGGFSGRTGLDQIPQG